MSQRSNEVLIMGARASQGMYGELLADPRIADEEHPLPSLTFYDPDSTIRIWDHLPNLNVGLREGRVRLVHEMPDEQVDAAVIATASGFHAEATQAVLDTQNRLPLFVLEKPLAASWHELDWFRQLEAAVQPASVTNEPYLFSRGVQELMRYGAKQEAEGNALLEIRAWSSKARRKVNPHGELGPYGVEVPHLHGGASLVAGTALDSTNVQENIYLPNIDGIPGNDGISMRFLAGERVVYVAQGLGKFAMNGYGEMGQNDTPPRTRRMSLRFENGQYVELDIDPAFPSSASDVVGHGVLRSYSATGDLVAERKISDNPRRDLARYVLRRINDPLLANMPHVSMSDSLGRSQILLDLRAGAEEVRGLSLQS